MRHYLGGHPDPVDDRVRSPEVAVEPNRGAGRGRRRNGGPLDRGLAQDPIARLVHDRRVGRIAGRDELPDRVDPVGVERPGRVRDVAGPDRLLQRVDVGVGEGARAGRLNALRDRQAGPHAERLIAAGAVVEDARIEHFRG